jgi:hypothetical protein
MIRGVFVSGGIVQAVVQNGVPAFTYQADQYWSGFPVRVLVADSQAELTAVQVSGSVAHYTHTAVYALELEAGCTWDGTAFAQSPALINQINDEAQEASRLTAAKGVISNLVTLQGSSGTLTAAQLSQASRDLATALLYMLKREVRLQRKGFYQGE